MKKKILIALAVLAALAVIGLAVFVLTLDSTIKKAVEDGGSYALKVPVKLEEVSLSLLGGRASLRGFSVDNPEGFKTEHAISIEEVSTEIKLSSLGSRVIEVPSLVLRRPRITIETKALGIKGSNVKRLMENLQETMEKHGVSGGKPAGKPAPKAEPAGEPQHYKVGRILITDATLSLADTHLTGGREAPVTVKQIDVPNLSTEMTVGQIIEVSLRAIVNAAAKQPGRVGELAAKLSGGALLKAAGDVKNLGEGALKGIKKVGEGALKGTGKGVGETVKGVGKGAGEVVKGVGKGVKEIGKGLGDIFKKKEDEKK